MKHVKFITYRVCGICIGICMLTQLTQAQTDADALMMKKNVFCIGAVYTHSSWKNYWEGDFKRDNENLGEVTTQMYAAMGNYGITNRINLLFALPYVQTRASQGTLKGQKGLQDLSVALKWMPIVKRVGKGVISVIGIGGVSVPVSDYVADFQPMSIGLHSRNIMVRGMVDYQRGHFFATTSAMYVRRSNIEIDRNSYYTTEMIYSNQVDIPDAAGFNVRTGLRSKTWIAEGVLENMTTLGGFDIRKNDMPFPSNRMNATQAGINLKYVMRAVPGLELTGGGKYTIAGKNMGQATTFYGGIFYIISFSNKKQSKTNYLNNKS